MHGIGLVTVALRLLISRQRLLIPAFLFSITNKMEITQKFLHIIIIHLIFVIIIIIIGGPFILFLK